MSFTSLVQSQLDIFRECPHAFFEDLSIEGREEFDASVLRLLEDIKREEERNEENNGEKNEEIKDESNFGKLRRKRMTSFPQASVSDIEGERTWYKILEWSSCTLIHAALRRLYVRYYSWGVIGTRAVEVLKQFSPILEVGSGNGYWAYELDRNGIDVVATDNHLDLVQDFAPFKTWFPVEELDSIAAIKKYPGRTLLMCWPHGYALDALEAFGDSFQGPKTVLIVGEKVKSGHGASCITDDPFGGVNKDRDSLMMSQVRDLLYNIQTDEIKEETQTDDWDYFDPKLLNDLANRYKRVQSQWKLAETISIPNFITSEEEETICDNLYIWKSI
eukprot:TRINITY_DN11888_c0_g1_i1.p1 TRINITY_DN11888_c0_g1~~TRINITY_DN11888_c0_g1_i1.p1  ORF type:complete len:332 (-),score=63.00 TRINITY_DN11888_c0_g1_i1:147-1142(-)